jgi:DNA-directed RNA polymerase subunit F
LAEKITEKLNITDKTVIECKDYELLRGDMKNPLWILKIHDELRVVLEVDEYMQFLETLKNIMKENFELKLEQAILSEFPVDYDDVKAVVLEEMKKNSEASVDEILDKVKLEHPNLFFKVELEELF